MYWHRKLCKSHTLRLIQWLSVLYMQFFEVFVDIQNKVHSNMYQLTDQSKIKIEAAQDCSVISPNLKATTHIYNTFTHRVNCRLLENPTMLSMLSAWLLKISGPARPFIKILNNLTLHAFMHFVSTYQYYRICIPQFVWYHT